MPKLDGYGLLQAMRSARELRSIPVIMVTAEAVSLRLPFYRLRILRTVKKGDEARLEGLLSGADDYISKPFTSRQLLARTHLQMQIGKRKAELENKFETSTGELRVLSELAPVGSA